MMWGDADGCKAMQRDAEGCIALGGCWLMLWGASGFSRDLIQKSRAGGWWCLPKPQEQPQTGQGGSHCLGCETGAHGGPSLEVLESHRASSEAVGGG